MFAFTTMVFVPLGQRLGRLLRAMPPLRAYGWDIFGSLVGIATITTLSFCSLPPVFWFLAFVVVSAPLLRPDERLTGSVGFAATLVVAHLLSHTSIWSSYYRIAVGEDPTSPGGYVFSVNNIGHQAATHYTDRDTFYFYPYDLLGQGYKYKNVLIIGAGTGSDVSVALANGAQRVTAVEIDRELYRLGRELHPDKPYDDPRVTVHINDGRAFLRHTNERFDLIIFALTDSLTLTSGYSSVRLETFLFTQDSMRDAAARLTDNGVLALYNYYRSDWSVERLAALLKAATGRPPFATSWGQTGHAASFLAGPGLDRLPPQWSRPYSNEGPFFVASGRTWPITGQGLYDAPAETRVATDDWPFFYLKDREMPGLFLQALGFVAVFTVGLIAFVAPKGTLSRFTPSFFWLGAAFMLLEARSLVTFALLFGTTWLVNALVFFAILSSVLLAVAVSARVRIKRMWLLYTVLFALLAANWLVPTSTLLAVDAEELRYVLAAVFAFAPVFVANLIFSQTFAGAAEADTAFAFNLIGIMLGGALEYAALVIGYQNLLLLVIAFYGLAFWGALRGRTAAA
jgi:SAM-dependent methyltransferase